MSGRFYRLAAIVSLLLFAGCTTVKTLDLTGMTVPPFPQGCTSIAGTVVGNENADIGYAYGVSHLACGNENIAVLKRTIRRENGHAISVVIDQIALPAGRPIGDYVIPGVCESPLHPGDHNLIAVGRWVVQPEYFNRLENIAGAWRVDLAKERIVPISTTGLSCELDIPD